MRYRLYIASESQLKNSYGFEIPEGFGANNEQSAIEYETGVNGVAVYRVRDTEDAKDIKFDSLFGTHEIESFLDGYTDEVYEWEHNGRSGILALIDYRTIKSLTDDGTFVDPGPMTMTNYLETDKVL